MSCQHTRNFTDDPFRSKCWKTFSVFLEISNTSTEVKEIFKFCKPPKKQQTPLSLCLRRIQWSLSHQSFQGEWIEMCVGLLLRTLYYNPGSSRNALDKPRIRILEKQPELKQDSPFNPWKTATGTEGRDQCCCERHGHIQHSPESCQSPGALL